MNRPFLSIIVPVYRVEEYLDQCVKSVLDQTYGDFELILVDDGSTDNSGKMCDEYAEKDNRIIVIHQKNGGLSTARNSGIKRARGQYIIFLDSDDHWLHKDFLEKLNLRLNKNSSDVICFNYRKSYSHKVDEPYFKIPSKSPNEDGVEFLSTNQIWIACAWNKAIKSELFLQHNLFFVEGIIAEDVDWCARLATYADSFDYINIDVVAYRQRASSITHTSSPKSVACLEKNVTITEKIIESADAYKKTFLYAYLSYQVAVLLFNILSLDRILQRQYRERMKKHMSYLKYASTRKTVLIYRCYQILGYELTKKLLSIVTNQSMRR